MRPRLFAPALALALFATPVGAAQEPPRPVVFVHGMGTSAADIGVPATPGAPGQWQSLLAAVAERWPREEVCQRDAQGERPWDGSPCVFRYVEDAAEAAEGGRAADGPNDSQSSVRENAAKLADELDEVVRNVGGQRVILVGYSMGGAIIRTYLALHRERAERSVEAVVLTDAVASGSWGFTLTGELSRRVRGRMGERLMEMLKTLAASSAAVDLDRPAPNELRPRSELFREITAVPPPSSISYYTFWGDIRVAVARQLYVYDLPDLELPSLGDLGLLPGDPDPGALPELGGQRFTPRVDAGRDAWDVPHEARVRITTDLMRRILEACRRGADVASGVSCAQVLSGLFAVPNQHTAVPVALGDIVVDSPHTGRTTLLDALLTAIARNQP